MKIISQKYVEQKSNIISSLVYCDVMSVILGVGFCLLIWLYAPYEPINPAIWYILISLATVLFCAIATILIIKEYRFDLTRDKNDIIINDKGELEIKSKNLRHTIPFTSIIKIKARHSISCRSFSNHFFFHSNNFFFMRIHMRIHIEVKPYGKVIIKYLSNGKTKRIVSNTIEDVDYAKIRLTGYVYSAKYKNIECSKKANE